MLGYTARQRPNSEGQQADEMNFSIPRPRKGQIFSESPDLLLFLLQQSLRSNGSRGQSAPSGPG